ncbi:hypothetical protein amrb99_39460 [Actinomadura sp. RB99]|nr:hypothetical protein [Actinomadura sp. RB99]
MFAPFPSLLPLLLLLLPLLPLFPLLGCVFLAFGDRVLAWPGGVVRACWGVPFGDGLGFGCRGGDVRGTTDGDGDGDCGSRSPRCHGCFGAWWWDGAGAGDCPGRCPVLAATATPPPNAASVAATTATLTVA